QQVSCLQTTY
ncbi:NAD(P) transhydrogenase beta subunit, partial [Vibrio parahaemolyticus V-223/04]